jgi:hypothetical protein
MTVSVWERSAVYAPRPTRCHGVRESGGYRLKLYSVVQGEDPIDWPVYEEGMALVLPLLPQPAVTPERPGVGFLIAHQGRGEHYLVAGWWDRENELFLRVARRPFGAAGTWAIASAGESGCVWDLRVFWFEREAYVASVLTPESGPDFDWYLSCRLDG